MKQSEWLLRNRKRELRILYREKRMEHETKKRTYKKEQAGKKAESWEKAIEVLHCDNKKQGKPDKKPGPNKFLELYSFIPKTVFDSRSSIPSSWKPETFNERRQHLEFLKQFVYPYPLPEVLIWISHLPEYTPVKTRTQDYPFIKLAKNWICDIVSGESFYKQNKEFFTKTEAHYFLTSKIPYENSHSIIKLYFYAKSRARQLNHKLSMMIADVFSVKFFNLYRNKVVLGFMDLLARSPLYNYERGMLGDISDFVLAQIRERKNNFSFSGRTIYSVIRLVNEWHYDLRRLQENQRRQHEGLHYAHQTTGPNEKPIDTSKWKGLGIMQFRYSTDEYTWTITELRSAQDLLNEGRKMKNCVSSYAYKCASGDTAIFTIERIYLANQIIDKAATVEVHIANREVVQAKGKCNTAITPKTMNVLTRWAQANRLTVRLMF